MAKPRPVQSGLFRPSSATYVLAIEPAAEGKARRRSTCQHSSESLPSPFVLIASRPRAIGTPSSQVCVCLLVDAQSPAARVCPVYLGLAFLGLLANMGSAASRDLPVGPGHHVVARGRPSRLIEPSVRSSNLQAPSRIHNDQRVDDGHLESPTPALPRPPGPTPDPPPFARPWKKKKEQMVWLRA